MNSGGRLLEHLVPPHNPKQQGDDIIAVFLCGPPAPGLQALIIEGKLAESNITASFDPRTSRLPFAIPSSIKRR